MITFAYCPVTERQHRLVPLEESPHEAPTLEVCELCGEVIGKTPPKPAQYQRDSLTVRYRLRVA